MGKLFKRLNIYILIASLLVLSGCSKTVPSKNNEGTENPFYEKTELKELKTFTELTGIKLTTTEETPESDSISYNYIMDNNAEGFAAVLKYETYLVEYGFKKMLTSDKINTYGMDGYYIVSGIFNPQDNIIQYVLNIPNTRVESEVSETTIAETTQESLEETKAKDYAESYKEFCEMVDSEDYTKAIEFQNSEEIPLDYENISDYYHYAEAMKLYKETEFLKFKDIKKVLSILSEDVSDGFKDSSEIITKIEGELKSLMGTFVQKRDSKYQYDALFYSMDDDGSGTLTMSTKKDGPEGGVSMSTYLAYVNLENGSYYMLCFPQDFEHCEYTISVQDEYIVLVKAWSETGNGVFAGNYTEY